MSTAIPNWKKGFGKTLRSDNWWLEPAIVVAGLTIFLIYSFWVTLQDTYYWVGGAEGYGGYLAPLCSPLLFVKEGLDGVATIQHSWIGTWPAWWPTWMPYSPTIWILAFPAIFRFTCYYYRKAYYRAFAGTPPACAVGAIPQKSYKGETGLLIFQNLHRISFYLVLPYIFFFFHDGYMAMFRDGQFGFGLGTILILLNAVMLSGYVFGCHAWRHLIGGQMDCMSCSKIRYGAWKKSSILNSKHQLYAWGSLITILIADVYIRLVSHGVISDINTWGN